MSSPADALREYLIDLGVVSRQYDPANPPGSDEWSSVIGRLPPGEDYPDRYVSIMDTGARAYATNMRDNDTAQHPNVSFNVRDVDYDAALAKTQEIEAAMKAVGVGVPDGNSLVQVATEDGVDWVVRSVAVVTPAMYVGQQEQNRREVFSVNFRVDLERVTPTNFRSVYPSGPATAGDFMLGIHNGLTHLFTFSSLAGAMGLVALPASAVDGDLMIFDGPLGSWRTANWKHVSPAGVVNGSNMIFVLPDTPKPVGSLTVFMNGLALRAGIGNDYTVAGNTVTMLSAPLAGDVLSAEYLT